MGVKQAATGRNGLKTALKWHTLVHTMLLAYDLTHHRPGSPLIQAVHGGSVEAAMRLPEHLWLHELSEDLKAYPVDAGQLDELVRITVERNK